MWTELTVEDWVDEINEGLKYRRLYGLEDSWTELEAIVSHVHKSQLVAGPNIIAATLDTMLSVLCVPEPFLSIQPTRLDYVQASKLWESVANGLITEMNLKQEIEDCSWSTYTWGRGFIKVGYDSEFGWDPDLDFGGKKNPIGLSLSSLDRKGRKIEFGDVRPGMPWAKNVLPHDIVVPWGTRTLEDAPWVAHRVLRHVEDVKADPKYEGTKGIQPVMSMRDFVKSYERSGGEYRIGVDETRDAGDQSLSESALQYCELWEIYDKRTGKIIVVATGHDRFLRNEPNMLLANGGFPFVSMCFNRKPKNFWTTSDAYYLKVVQAELSDIQLQATKQRRLSALKFLYDKGAIDDDEMTRALSAEVGVAIKVNSGYDVAKAIQIFQPGGNWQLYQEASQTMQNARQISGLSKNQMGEELQGTRRTAQEVQMVAQGANLRTSKRGAVVGDVYCKTMEKIRQIVRNNWSLPRIVQVAGPDEAQGWAQITGDDLTGNFTYKCGFTEESTMSRQQRFQMALNLYIALRQDPLIDPSVLARIVANAANDPLITALFRQGVLNGQINPQMLQGQMGQGGAGQVPQSLPGPQAAGASDAGGGSFDSGSGE